MTTIFEALLVFLAIGALMYFAFRKSSGCCGGHSHRDSDDKERHRNTVSKPGTTKDPVCGMTVETVGNALTTNYGGRTAHFCSDHCKERFDHDPEQFIATRDSAHAGCCS